MNSEEKFKDLLTDKLGSKEFTFDQRHWNDMSERIDRSRERKFRGIWLWIFCLVSLSGSIAVYFIGSSNQNMADTKTGTSETLKPLATTLPRLETTRQVQTTRVQDLKPIRSAPMEIVPSTVKTKEPASAELKTPASPKAVKTKANSTTPAEPVAQTDTKQTQTSSAPSTPMEPNTVTPPETIVPQIVKETEDPAVSEVVESANTQIPGSQSLVADSTVTEPTVVAQAVTVAEIKKTDSVSPVVQDNIVLPEDPGMIRHFFFAEAGANYLSGWKTNDTRDGRGVNFTGGVNYMYALNRKLGVSGGLHYTETGHLSAWSHESKSKSYSFGERIDVTVITPEKVSYLQVPFKVNYAVTDRNVFGAGYIFSYLLTVKSKVETSGQGYGYTPSGSSSITRGYTEGFNMFDSQVSVFYRHRFYDRLWLNAEVLLGIMDSRKNAFFGNPVAERNSGLKLSVMYTLFQK